MREGSLRIAAALPRAIDVTRFRHVVDVGGGDGSLLVALLRQCPARRATLCDQPDVVAGCDGAEVANRLRIRGGDFFACVPEEGDAYILKFILHDWDDEAALVLLLRCRGAMRPTSRLLVIERLLAPANEGAEGKLSDLNMLVNLGGRERSPAAFEALLAKAGFDLLAVTPLDAQLAVLEAAPARPTSCLSLAGVVSTASASPSHGSPHAPLR